MDEQELIKKAIQGDKKSLNDLLDKHQGFIFNVSLKMLNDVVDAQDATQEVLIKVLTSLSTFDTSKAKFTTWVYRITFNHIMNFKKSAWEKTNVTFENFFQFMENVPDVIIPEEEDQNWLSNIEETKITCTSGMLMCLDREQRLIYILGDIFKIDQSVAAEIFDISAANFRKKLSRTRKDLHQWMHQKCGLVNTDNPCRCRNKTKKLIEMGEVDPENKKWLSGYQEQIVKHTQTSMKKFGTSKDEVYNRIFQEHPFKTNLKADEIYNQIVSNKDFSKFMNL
ncbi:MAG: RNA polymerase subunit sigma-70 [Bacteroidetes bacterium]|nr:MAG: RNA polymerase subunit sigma-70 [Bacteroidota bacterium]